MALSAFVTLCLLALASAATQTNPENVAKIDALLPELCTLSQGQSDMKVASLVAHGIDLLKFTPDDAVVGVLEKIRAGQYCADNTKLESLFLDAVAFVGTPGAFKVMEQEIQAGRTTGGRLILYTVAMTPLRPILEEYKLIATNKGTELIKVIQAFIKDNKINVDKIAEELKKIDIDTVVEELKKITLLVQNTMKEKNINTETVVLELNKLMKLVQDTIKDKDIHIETLVAELQKLTQLIQDTLKTKGVDTDVVIAKFKALLQLALNTIKEKNINIDTITVELQRLLQLVQDTIKDKNINMDTAVAEVNKLVQQVVNTINDKDINMDTIVNELNKLIQLVLNTIKEKNINIDTITSEAQRFIQLVQDAIKEKNINMETIVSEVNKLVQLVQNTIKETNINMDTIVAQFKKFLQVAQVTLKENGINTDIIVGELNLLVKPAMEIIKNKDIYIDTIKVELTKLAQPVSDFIMKTLIPAVTEALVAAKDFNLNTARTGHIHFDILIPTTMGHPLKIKLTATAVAGMKLINNLDVKKSALDSLVKIIPSLNAHFEVEFGLGEQMITGLKLKHDVYTTNGFALSLSQKNGEDLELKYELPEKMEIFSFQNEVILMNNGKVLNEEQLFPAKMQGIKIISNECATIIEPVTGLLFCYDVNTPSIMNSKVRVYIQKSDATMNGYRLSARLRNKPEKKLLKLVAGTYGSENSKESTMKLTYTAEADAHLMTLNVQSTLVKSTTEITLTNQPELKSLQIYSNDKIGTFAPIFGSAKVEFKPVTVSNGKTYEVAAYAGLAKSLDEKHRLTQMKLSLIENGDLISAKFVTKTDFFPAMFEVEADLPKTAGLKVYKVEKLTVRYSVSTVVVESTILKKSAEEFQTTLLVLHEGSSLLNIDAVHTISVDSTLIGGSTNKVNLMTSVNGKLPTAEFGLDTKMGYENGVVVVSFGVRHFDSKVIAVSSELSYSNGALETLSSINYYDSEILALSSKLAYANGALEIFSNIKHFESEALALSSKLAYANGALEIFSNIKYFESEALALSSKLAYTNGALEASSIINYNSAEVLAVSSKFAYMNGALETLSNIKYYNSEALVLKAKMGYTTGALETSSSIKYYNDEVLALSSKFAYISGAVEAISSIQYYNAEALELKAKLTYTKGALETTGDIKYFGSELVHVHSNLGFNNALVEFTSTATYLDSTVFTAKLQQTLDISNLVFLAEFNSPLAEVGVQKKMTFSNMVFESSNLVLCSGSEFVNMISTLSYTDGSIDFSSKATSQYFGTTLYHVHVTQTVEARPFNFATEVEITTVFKMNLQQTVDSKALTTVAQVEIPTMIKPLKINHVIEINSAFSYNVHTDVKTGDSALLHIEGPMSFDFSRKLVQQNLDLKISGAFDGTYKVMHGITISMKKIQYTLDMRHTSTPVVLVEFVLDRSNTKEVAIKSNVNVPFVTKSAIEITLSTSLLHSTMNVLTLPSTPYARRFKGYSDFNWVENSFKCDLYWDAEKNNDMKIGFTTKYALDTTALKLIIQGDLTVTSLSYNYKIESGIASPFEWFQGVSGTELIVTMPTQQIAVAKAFLEIQYSESQVEFRPVFAFIAPSERLYELTTSVVMKKLPTFLSFALTSETTLTTPQLQKVTLTTSLKHENNKPSETVELKMILAESVLSEAFSFEYVAKAVPSEISDILKVMKGSKVASWSNVLHLTSGLNAFEYTNELTLPFAGLKSLVINLTKTSEGTTSLALAKNQENLVRVYYSMPSFTSHIVGIEFPSRTLEFSAVFARNQVTFKVFPEKNQSAKVVETTFRLIKKAGAGQFEILVTAPSLSKEMRFAVELELVEPGKDGLDMVSLDVQYQVTEAPMLLKATLQELKNIYSDLVKDGMSPDLNRLYRKVQKLFKQIPKVLNSVRDELKKSVPVYYEMVKNYALDLYKLHEADVIALWETARTELLKYFNTVKTEAPVVFNKYVAILKKTETWMAVQTLLREVVVNYPIYYDAAVDFYNKVIIPYVTEVTEMVGQFLVLPEFDISQYVTIFKKEASAIVKNLSTQLMDTQAVMLMKEKFTELKSLYPTEFSLLEDVYTNVVLPSSTEVLAMVNKMVAVPAFDYQKYWEIVIAEVPELFNKLSQRILSTQIVNKLRAAYPTLFIITEDIYSNVIVPTINELVAFVKKVTSLPVDFQEYLTVAKVEVPVIATHFVQRVLDTQLLNNVRQAFPIVFEVSEDLYTKVVLPTLGDALVLAEKLIAVPVVDFQETFKQYWAFIKTEVPPMFNKFVQRLPETILVQKMRTVFPMVFEVASDFYTKVIVPTTSDFATVVEHLLAVPVSDIVEAGKQYWTILEFEIPTLMGKFFGRLPETQIVMIFKEKSTVLIQLLQEKVAELKAHYPKETAFILDFYNNVAVPAYSECVVYYQKLSKLSDIYQIRDLLVTDILEFVRHRMEDLGNTEFGKIVVAKFFELCDKYQNEYQAVLRFYNQISQITVADIFASVKSYINDDLHISFSISTEKFAVVFPLPVSVATVRNYYHLITVIVPSDVAEFVAQVVAKGRELIKVIEAKIPVVIEYINAQAPIYAEFINKHLETLKVFINNHLETLKVTIPQYIEKIQADLPKYLEEVHSIVHPYIQEFLSTVMTNFELAKNSVYAKIAEEKVREIVELLVAKYNEVIALYPAEYQAVMDFLSLYMNICMDYAAWAINTVVEYPPVQKAIEYLINLTPEKAQAKLDMIVDAAMSTLSQLESRVNDLIAAIPKDIPAFLEMHLPAFIINFLKSILSYLQ